ncbi:MAG TPA: serine hydrolase domain-containing protein, partial [Bacteroidales bacterium]|nr:serine hydrolase domain-containing protein [Bacteroidales bacterium]
MKELDEFIIKEMKAWNVAGLAIATVENNELTLLKGYGVEDMETGNPVDPQSTIFHVASISKPVTASAVLQLYEQGQLDIHKGINEYLNEVQFKNPFPNYPTAAQLLVHAGGLDASTINRVARNKDKLNGFNEYIEQNLPPIIHPPGSISVYSNHGYALLGYLAREISGQPFPRYMEQNIFEPLGMSRSTFNVHSPLEQELATGYGLGPNQGNRKTPAYIKTIPASMLRTTALDMSHWMRAILNDGSFNGNKILEPGTARLLLNRQYSNHRLLTGRSFGLSEGGRFSPPEFLHAGAASGYTSAMVMVPEVNFGVFITTNSNAYLWGIVNK